MKWSNIMIAILFMALFCGVGVVGAVSNDSISPSAGEQAKDANDVLQLNAQESNHGIGLNFPVWESWGMAEKLILVFVASVVMAVILTRRGFFSS